MTIFIYEVKWHIILAWCCILFLWSNFLKEVKHELKVEIWNIMFKGVKYTATFRLWINRKFPIWDNICDVLLLSVIIRCYTWFQCVLEGSAPHWKALSLLKFFCILYLSFYISPCYCWRKIDVKFLKYNRYCKSHRLFYISSFQLCYCRFYISVDGCQSWNLNWIFCCSKKPV